MGRYGRIVLLGLVLGSATNWHPGARAQEPSLDSNPFASAENEPGRAVKREAGERNIGIGRESLIRLIQTANPLLWPLLACSVVMAGYIFERGLALRRGRVIPKDFSQRFLERLGQGKLDRERALELCRANDSPVARIYGHALRYWGQPAAVIRQAVDHDAASELLALRKNVRVLNATATIAPLLGLLGTVVGMVESFDAVGGGRVGGDSRSAALAHGISLALMTTGVGLAIAIVSVCFYYYFLQRIDNLVHDLDHQARLVIDLISAEAIRASMPPPTIMRGPMVSPGQGPSQAAAGPDPGQGPGPGDSQRPPARSLGRVETL